MLRVRLFLTFDITDMGRTDKRKGATWEIVQNVAQGLPDALEGTSYGTPAFFVRKKLFVRLHQSGESIVINISIDEREALMGTDPETFFITDHYQKYPYMLVRLSTVGERDLQNLVQESWRRCAPATLIDAFDKKK